MCLSDPALFAHGFRGPAKIITRSMPPARARTTPPRTPSPVRPDDARGPPPGPKRARRTRSPLVPGRAARSLAAELAAIELAAGELAAGELAAGVEKAHEQLAEAKGEARFKRMQACFTPAGAPGAAPGATADALNFLQQVALELDDDPSFCTGGPSAASN